jgi:hypothetical protein
MHRLLPLLLVSAGPLAAQSVPDTTSAERYFPLQVGNVWEYQREGLIEGYERRSIPADTSVGGTDYVLYQVDYFALDGTPTDPTQTFPLRIDPATNALTTPSGDPNDLAGLFLTTCPLDSDFFDELFDCPGSAVVLTSGGPETVHIGEDSVETSLKYFDDNSREVLGLYAADVGFLGFLMRTGQLSLVYAYVGGTTYGDPIPVANSPGPEPAGRSLIGVSPNPSSGPVAIRAELAASGPVLIQAWDALGRRVFAESLFHAAGPLTLDLPAERWAPGLYVVTLDAGRERGVARLVLR